MLRKTRIDNAGIIMLTVFSAMLGLNQALVKLVNAGFSPIFQAGLRSVCAFFIVLSFALIFKKAMVVYYPDSPLGFYLQQNSSCCSPPWTIQPFHAFPCSSTPSRSGLH
jgi:drug/metabolite transporter (DMT)-like permease